MPKVKTSKRSELKENILANKVEKVIIWASEHRPLVLGLLGGIVVIGLFSSVVIIRNKERRELQWTLLARADELLRQQRFDQSQKAYEDIIKAAGTDSVSLHAKYHLAEQALIEKKADVAIEKFSNLVETAGKSPLRPLALSNLAVSYEQKKDFELAAQTYQKFMDEYSGHFLAARNQLALGRSLAYAGQTDAAQEALGQLVDLYPTSVWAENAREIMDKIKSR